MRKSFIIDGKKVTPRKGKYIAQGAHASMAAILEQAKQPIGGLAGADFIVIPLAEKRDGFLNAPTVLQDWLLGKFTKICTCVETEEELLAVYNAAKAKGLMCSLITDAGLTEFGGVPTITCCAIGPAWSDELDEITGKLELF